VQTLQLEELAAENCPGLHPWQYGAEEPENVPAAQPRQVEELAEEYVPEVHEEQEDAFPVV
jgi:hypothetical protein